MAIHLLQMVERMAEQLANDCEQFARLNNSHIRVWLDHAASWRKQAADIRKIYVRFCRAGASGSIGGGGGGEVHK